MGILVASGLARGTGRITVSEEDGVTGDERVTRAPRPVQEPPELLRLTTMQIAMVVFRRSRLHDGQGLRAVSAQVGDGGQFKVFLGMCVGLGLLTTTHAQSLPHFPPLDRVLPPRAETIYQDLSPGGRQGGDGLGDVDGADVASGRQSGVRAIATADLRSAGGRRMSRDMNLSRTAAWDGSRREARCDSAVRPARSCCLERRIAWHWPSIRSARRPGGATFRLIDAGAGRPRPPMRAKTSRVPWCSSAGPSARRGNRRSARVARPA